MLNEKFRKNDPRFVKAASRLFAVCAKGRVISSLKTHYLRLARCPRSILRRSLKIRSVTFGVTNMQETMAGYEVNVSEHLR